MRQLAFLFALCVLLFSFAGVTRAHDIHISYAKAELKDGVLSVKVSYYKDDFTRAVKDWYAAGANAKSDIQAEEFEYVKNYFRVWSGNYQSPITPELTARHDDGTSVIFEMKFTADTSTSLILDQRVLFKEYPDQMNILFIKAFSKEANHIFTVSKPTLIVKP
ncbi:MAG: DUF6702 family protein [Ignavibacteriota bacterium]